MIAPILNLRGLLRGLHSHEVRYLVSGAMAMVFYGYVRNTEDLDLIVDPDPENLDRLADWLTSAGATLRLNPMSTFGDRERTGLHRGAKVSVLTSLGQVDVDQQLPGLPEFSQLMEQAELYETDGMQVPVVNRETLIELKRSRGSFLDRADIEAIERIGGHWEEDREEY
ncbi:MAG TPA: hypothetical protein VGF70_14455 [Solirubrobacteraceae bacterium]|jgi:hypothetical protein